MLHYPSKGKQEFQRYGNGSSAKGIFGIKENEGLKLTLDFSN